MEDFELDTEDPIIFGRHVIIQLDNSQVNQGGSVTGSLILDLQHSLPPCTLVLQLIGIQKTTLKHGPELQNKNEFLKVEQSILTIDESVEQGEHIYPLEIKLPYNLPATFLWYQGINSKATIRYKLKAFLKGEDLSTDFIKYYSTKEQIFIRDTPFQSLNLPYLIEQGAHHPAMKIQLREPSSDQNSNIELTIRERNLSRDLGKQSSPNFKISSITVSFTRHTEIRDEHGVCDRESEILVIKKLNQKSVLNRNVSISLPDLSPSYLPNLETYWKHMQQRQKQTCALDLHYLGGILPSVNSPLISCLYTIEINFSFKKAMFSRDKVQILIPVWISSKQNEESIRDRVGSVQIVNLLNLIRFNITGTLLQNETYHKLKMRMRQFFDEFNPPNEDTTPLLTSDVMSKQNKKFDSISMSEVGEEEFKEPEYGKSFSQSQSTNEQTWDIV